MAKHRAVALDDVRIECYFAIRERIALRAEQYRRDFGAVPAFRVGMHGGPIVAGECGDDKREIVYFGDTIIAAARIQEACKELGCSLLVSAALLRRMRLAPGRTATSRGRVKLRGLAQEIELFTVDRAAARGD